MIYRYLWAELDVKTEIWIQSFINGEPRAHINECGRNPLPRTWRPNYANRLVRSTRFLYSVLQTEVNPFLPSRTGASQEYLVSVHSLHQCSGSGSTVYHRVRI